ncbi:MAG: RimK family alpha-L-glutamate ligase [Planctomyces sp.]|nr:RimK family alpha-L-glutamate ligase [Planctomyces sp.]
MNVVVLGNAGSWYVADLERAARDRGDRCERWEFTRLATEVATGSESIRHEASALEGVDSVIVRTMPPGSLEQVVFRMNLLARAERLGATVINSARAIECAVDKHLTTARLQEGGLPVPETFVCETADDALAALERLGGDVVVKPLFGAEGRGIVRVSDPDLGLRVFRAIERTGGVLYLQRFVPHEGYDVRVLVLDGEVLGGMTRRSASDFRTNVARDARAEPHEPTDVERDFSLRAAAATGARFAGIDLLYDRDGRLYVIEVNGVPGWRAFGRVSGMDVAARLLDAVARDRAEW